MFFTSIAYSHSYLTCSDYVAESNECCGFARNFQKYVATAIRGYEFKSDVKHEIKVDPAQTIDSYTPQYQMAQVAPGGSLVLTWPPNNHANGGDKDGSADTVKQAFIYEGDGSSGTKVATMDFTNCDQSYERNSEGTINSLCSAVWKVDLPEGTYAFVWAWLHDDVDGYYTTAFDIKVTADPKRGECRPTDGKPVAPKPCSSEGTLNDYKPTDTGSDESESTQVPSGSESSGYQGDLPEVAEASTGESPAESSGYQSNLSEVVEGSTGATPKKCTPKSY